MNGNSRTPVLAPAPAHPDGERQPRYYRVRPRGHRVAGGALLAVAALGVAALALRGGTLPESSSPAPAATSADGQALVPGAVPDVGGAERSGAAPVPAVAAADAELDVDSVTIVGDSITEASAGEITDALAALGVETIDVKGKARRRIDVGDGSRDEPLSGVRQLRQLLAGGADPDVWVIALGTNDVSLYPDAEAYGQLIDTVLSMIPRDPPLVWVDVFRPRQAEHTRMFNTVLAERIAARGNAALAPWHAYASTSGNTILRSDDLHPNAEGTKVFAGVITATIVDLLDD